MTSAYGNFVLNDNRNYYLLSKSMDSVTYKTTLQKIARMDGMKQTGQIVNERTITCSMKVTGTSRVDLETKLDALYQALSLRQQPLTLHAIDARYFTADCIDIKTTLQGNEPIKAMVALTFLCANPYAYSTLQSTFDTGTITLNNINGTLYSSSFSTSSGGTAVALPTIRVTLQNNAAMSALTVIENTDGRSLVVASNLPQVSGDYVDMFCDVTQIPQNGYSVLLNGAMPCAFNGIFPVLQTYTTTYTVQVNASSSPQVRVLLSWYPRYQG